MSEEGDSWFKAAFGVDLGQTASRLTEVAGEVIQEAKGLEARVQGVVQGAINQVTGAAAAVVQQVTGGGSTPTPAAGVAAGGGTSSFPLGGSVGRGGKNAANDVRAVQAALGIGIDGQCGGQTIAAIEAFQRSMGQSGPDGRVDAGGATERALAGGSQPTFAAKTEDDDGISKLIQDAAAAFSPVISFPSIGNFDMGASLSQAADEVRANNAPTLPLLARAEALVDEARRILDANITPDESVDLPSPTIRFNGKCCSADELQRFRIAIEAPRNASQGSINAFKDADRAVVEACEQGKKICYGALATCVATTLSNNPQVGVGVCLAGSIACIGGSTPVQNAIRVQAKAEADLEVANGALGRALANYRNAFVFRCDTSLPPLPPGVR